jgi:hypothetical protein
MSAAETTAGWIQVFDLGCSPFTARSYQGQRRFQSPPGIIARWLFLDEHRVCRTGPTCGSLAPRGLHHYARRPRPLAIDRAGSSCARREAALLGAAAPSRLPAGSLPPLARDLAGEPLVRDACVEDGGIRLSVTDTTQGMAAVFSLLAARGIGIRAASLAQPSLDDVFLHETGRSLRDAGAPAGEPAGQQAEGHVAA